MRQTFKLTCGTRPETWQFMFNFPPYVFLLLQFLGRCPVTSMEPVCDSLAGVQQCSERERVTYGPPRKWNQNPEVSHVE